jgi:hypothetical protein
MSGAPHNPRLTALWITDPHGAAAIVRDALENNDTLEEAAGWLQVGLRTLYRWIETRPELRLGDGEMTPRQLRGAINRAKNVYALCAYNPENTFHVKVSKEAARELSDAAHSEDGKPEDIVASEDSGDLYIGFLPGGGVEKTKEEENDDE